MLPVAIILVTLSACVHAGWNLALKRQSPSSGLFFLAVLIGTAAFSPVLIYFRDDVARIPATVWLLLAATGFFQALYYASLAGSYRCGDISIAYPIARSLPVVLVPMVAFAIGRGREISWPALAGMVLIAFGCFVLPMRRLGELRWKNYGNLCSLLAAMAAMGTAGYSIIDNAGLVVLRDPAGLGMTAHGAALIFIVLEGFTSLAWLGVFVFFSRDRRADLATACRSAKRQATLMGLGVYVAYTLVLTAMAFVHDVSYVVAFRQLGIPLGAILGIVVLRESRFMPKYIGLALVCLGLVLVATG